jgi:RNA polymerase sigma factor (sigma-70 family)
VPQPDFPDDRTLIEGYLLGEPAALRIMDRWIDAALRSRLFPSDTLEDLRQDVRMRLFKSLRADSFRGGSSLKTYVHQIARNAGADFLHRSQGAAALPPGGEGSEAGAAEKGAIAEELVQRILESLPEGDRKLMTLLFVERCSYAEAARRLGKSVGAIKVQVHRCRRKIRLRHGDLAAELHGFRTGAPAAIGPAPPGSKDRPRRTRKERRGAAARR